MNVLWAEKNNVELSVCQLTFSNINSQQTDQNYLQNLPLRTSIIPIEKTMNEASVQGETTITKMTNVKAVELIRKMNKLSIDTTELLSELFFYIL